MTAINHPNHYGGEDNPYEAIKVIEAWGANFNIGNCMKYIARYKHKGRPIEDLQKALWYLEREIGREVEMRTDNNQMNDELRKALGFKR